MQTSSRESFVQFVVALAIQAWKGCRNPKGPEEFWSDVLDYLDSDLIAPLRVNKYVGAPNEFFHEFFSTERSSMLEMLSPTEAAGKLVAKYAIDTTDRLLDFLRSIRWDGKVSAEWMQRMDLHYAILYINGVWGANLKYHSAWLYSHYETGGIVPLEKPVRGGSIVGKDGFLVMGAAYAYLMRELQGNRGRAKEVRLTLLQGLKKSFLPLDARSLKDTLRDHRIALSTPRQTSDRMIEECERVGRELRVRTGSLRIPQNGKWSSHACIENKRSFGGFAGIKLDSHGYDPISMALGIPTLVGEKLQKGCFGQPKYLYSRFFLTYKDLYRESREDHWDCVSDGPGLAEVRAISEPFKFRVISLGEEKAYSTLRPLQQLMWRTLQKFDCFGLTGYENRDPTLFVSNFVTKFWQPGWVCVSGDWKAATDNLHTDCMLAVAREWFTHEPELYAEIRDFLGSAEVTYGSAGCTVGGLVPGSMYPEKWIPESFIQKNGQLMGNPLSFPLLCAVNAAVCRLAIEDTHHRQYKLDEVPMLINGDDCALLGPREMEKLWVENGRDVGLDKSVGKSYTSSDFLMINSQYFDVRGVRVDPVFPVYRYYVHRNVGFVNLGVMTGRRKGNHDDLEVKASDPTTEENCYKFLVSASDNHRQMMKMVKYLPDQLGRYLSNHKHYLRRIPLPLGLPKDEGGFGFQQAATFGRCERVPKFRGSLPGNILLGEAYFCGSISTTWDSLVMGVNGFLTEVREYGKRLSRCQQGCRPGKASQDYIINVMKCA